LVKPHLAHPITPVSASEITEQKSVEQKIIGVHSIGSKDEQKEWELWSEEALGYQDEKKWDLSKVKVAFFNASEQTFRVTGDAGNVDMETKDLLINGNVISESTQGYIFTTDQLIYNSQSRELRSPNEVEFLSDKDSEGARFLLKGRSLFANVDKNTLEIKEDVNGTRTSRKGEVTKIKSRKMKFNGQDHQVEFEENVELKYKSMTVQGPSAAFIYSKKENKVTNIRIFGGVKLTDQVRSATAKLIDINLKTETIRLVGKPRVLQNNDLVLGEEIILSNGGKRVEVRNVRAKVEEQNGE
jgi:hypothetical protein